MVNKIVASILGNEKRMAKLRSFTNHHKAIDQAKNYIKAECLANKVKLSEDEIIKTAVMLCEEL